MLFPHHIAGFTWCDVILLDRQLIIDIID